MGANSFNIEVDGAVFLTGCANIRLHVIIIYRS